MSPCSCCERTTKNCWWLVVATTTSRVYIISLSSLYGSLLISRIWIQKEDEQPLKAAGIGIAAIASLFHALFPPELAGLLDEISLCNRGNESPSIISYEAYTGNNDVSLNSMNKFLLLAVRSVSRNRCRIHYWTRVSLFLWKRLYRIVGYDGSVEERRRENLLTNVAADKDKRPVSAKANFIKDCCIVDHRVFETGVLCVCNSDRFITTGRRWRDG